MEDLTNIEEVVEQPKENAPTETVKPEKTKNELLRELSKEHGVNLFDVDGLKKFKEFTESQKSELEVAQSTIETLKQEKAEWETTKQKWENETKARELGINSEYLEDALKLANNDPNNLQSVLDKYPMFKEKKAITIGVTDPNNDNQPSGLSEAEKYMAQNPQIYKK